MSKTAKFAFGLGDRVSVPPLADGMPIPGWNRDDDLQGIVCGRKQTIHCENTYDIAVLLADLQTAVVQAAESELSEAQPIKPKPRRKR